MPCEAVIGSVEAVIGSVEEVIEYVEAVIEPCEAVFAWSIRGVISAKKLLNAAKQWLEVAKLDIFFNTCKPAGHHDKFVNEKA